MTKTFNPTTLRKAGFINHKDKNFSDDGTRFSIWSKDGVFVSYAKSDGDVYLSVRPDYSGLRYETYKAFPSYAHANDFNGVDESRVDMDAFVANVKAMAEDMAR